MMNTYNKKEKSKLVMLGGLGCNKEIFMSQMPILDVFSEVYSLELLGQGENQTSEPITLEAMAKDILKQMDELKINKCHILGLSLGGIVSQECIRQDRNRFESLILANTLTYFPYIPTQLIEFFKPLSVKNPDTHLDTVLQKALHNHSAEIEDRARRGFTINPSTYEQCAKSGLYVNYTALLNGWNKPTLILVGEYDHVVDKWFGYQSYYSLPYCNHKKRIVEFPTGHLSCIEAPEQFNNEIRKFFLDYFK